MTGRPLTWRALTLVQPMASAIALLATDARGKDIENRTQPIGRHVWPSWVGLHTGKSADASYLDLCRANVPDVDWDEAPRGVMLGAMLIDWIEEIPTSKIWMMNDEHARTLRASLWTFGPWCLHVAEVRLLAKPIHCRGMLGLWPVMDGGIFDALDELVPLEAT